MSSTAVKTSSAPKAANGTPNGVQKMPPPSASSSRSTQQPQKKPLESKPSEDRKGAASSTTAQRKPVEKKPSQDSNAQAQQQQQQRKGPGNDKAQPMQKKPSGDEKQRSMEKKPSGNPGNGSGSSSRPGSSSTQGASSRPNSSTSTLNGSTRKPLENAPADSSSSFTESVPSRPAPRRAISKYESEDAFKAEKKHGPPSIHSDAADGDVAKVQEWLDKEVDINKRNKNGASALIIAASYGQTAVAKLLVDRGADLDLKNYSNNTALMYAAGKGYAEIVEYLLKNHAKVDERDNEGRTALILATYADCAELLLDHGANVLEMDNNGETALFHIAERKQDYHLETAKVLLARGAAVNDIGDHRQTPIMRAAFVGNEPMVRLFLEYGADVTLRDDRDRTARDMALEKGFRRIADLLEQKELEQATDAVPVLEEETRESASAEGEGLFGSVTRWIGKKTKSGKSIGRSNSSLNSKSQSSLHNRSNSSLA